MKSKKILTILALTSLLTLASCDSKTEPSNNSSHNNSSQESNNTKPDNPSVNPDVKPDIPNIDEGYYAGITGEKGVLKNNLHKLISKREMTSYDDLWRTYKISDIRDDGKIMDIYSNTTNFRPGTDQAGSYKKEGDVYNREHTIPKSWWGGSKNNQGADPFIVFPSDGYVNNRRSSYPFGEVSKVTYQSNNGYCKLGSSKYPGVGTVFEPADEWKGDMARAYFYATTCYTTTNWTKGDGAKVFSTNGNYGLTSYASKLFLKWHKEDPVSEWELKRNNAIYGINNNRNPYIDHPEFVELIWGNETF